MEEAVGKLWHRWITRAAQIEHPDKRVELKQIQQRLDSNVPVTKPKPIQHHVKNILGQAAFDLQKMVRFGQA